MLVLFWLEFLEEFFVLFMQSEEFMQLLEFEVFDVLFEAFDVLFEAFVLFIQLLLFEAFVEFAALEAFE